MRSYAHLCFPKFSLNAFFYFIQILDFVDLHVGKVTVGVMMKTIMQVVTGTEGIAAVKTSELTFAHLVNALIQITVSLKL